jgi:hypothetical protein
MFTQKVAACLSGLVVLALALPMLAGAQAPEKASESAAPAAQEADQPEPSEKDNTEIDAADAADAAGEGDEADAADPSAPAEAPEPDEADADGAATGALALLLDGQDVTGGDVSLSWAEGEGEVPTALIRAVGPDGLSVSPDYFSSDPAVADVDESGLVTATGLGTATVIATLDAQTASLQVSVGRRIERVVIIAEDSVSPGHSIKLRAFDQDGNRISVKWHASPERLVEITSEGVLTVRRAVAGQAVEVTAAAEDGSMVSAVKEIRIE